VPVELLIILLVWFGVVAVGLIGVTVVNARSAAQFMAARQADPSVGGVSTAAWWVSVIGALAGPLALLGAIVAIVMGLLHIRRYRAAGPIHVIPGRMAVLNGIAVLIAAVGFGVWTLLLVTNQSA
jgi:lipid-A-disaccharide synthase-like uncharacterized protein